FSKVTGSLDEATATEPEPQSPTVSDPITLSKSKVVIPSGKASGIKIAVYNPSTVDQCAIVVVEDGSTNAANTNCMALLQSYESSPIKMIPAQKSEVFLAVLKGIKTSEEQSDLCSFTIYYYAATGGCPASPDPALAASKKYEEFQLQVSS
ncbi:MAG: hypothetical protein V1659_00830, partial [Candidatus Woesearchaeota archaeon]